MSFLKISQKPSELKQKKRVKTTRKGIYTPFAFIFPHEKCNKRINRTNSQNGHFIDNFWKFSIFFEKAVYHISYFDPLVILSIIIKLSKIWKMYAKLVKIRQCKKFYFEMGLIELSMGNMSLHKCIYRGC